MHRSYLARSAPHVRLTPIYADQSNFRESCIRRAQFDIGVLWTPLSPSLALAALIVFFLLWCFVVMSMITCIRMYSRQRGVGQPPLHGHSAYSNQRPVVLSLLLVASPPCSTARYCETMLHVSECCIPSPTKRKRCSFSMCMMRR